VKSEDGKAIKSRENGESDIKNDENNQNNNKSTENLFVRDY
jgi:hypothetical protein